MVCQKGFFQDCILHYMLVFIKGGEGGGEEDCMKHKSRFDTAISLSVVSLLVKHFEQCCSALAVGTTIHECVSRNGSGRQKPKGSRPFTKTCGTRANHVLSQVLSTNVLGTFS